jgi:hypothetical protein
MGRGEATEGRRALGRSVLVGAGRALPVPVDHAEGKEALKMGHLDDSEGLVE